MKRKRENESLKTEGLKSEKKKEIVISGTEQGTLSDDQYLALILTIEGGNIAINGSAGTGKSHLLRRIYQELSERNHEIAVTASTGIAATNLNLGATTVHSFIGAGLCDGPLSDMVKLVMSNRKAKEKILRITTLIIDEISMISPNFFYKIDHILRGVRECPLPFGGVQLIVCGDWAQLGPVPDHKLKEPWSKMTYCFETENWKEAFEVREMDKIIVLETNFRQSDDKEFIQMLNDIKQVIDH